MQPPNSPRTEEQAYMAAMLAEQRRTNELLTQLLGQPKVEEKQAVPKIKKRLGKRNEIIAEIMNLPIDKPKGWTKLPNEKLMELLKRGEA